MSVPNPETAEIKVEDTKVETTVTGTVTGTITETITETVVTTTATETIETTETTETTTEIVEEDKKEVETAKIEENKENGTSVPETPEPIYKGHLLKHHNKFFAVRNQRHFELSEDPIPKDNLNLYYKKSIKDVPKKAPPTKPSSEPEKPSAEPEKSSAEPEKPSSEPEKQTDAPASDTPASDVPASDVSVSKDEKEEQKEQKEQNESDQFDKIHFCNIAHAIQTGKGLLFYYKNEKSLDKRIPWGIINLKGATVEVDKTSSNKFRIFTKAGKVHILEAYSEKEKSRWVYSINEEIKKAEDIDAIYASDEYKNTYDQLVTGQFKFVAKEGITSDSEPLSDSDDKQGRPDKRRSLFPFSLSKKAPETPTTETTNATETTTTTTATITTTTTTNEVTTAESDSKKIAVNTDGVNTADVSPDDGTTKSPKSSKSFFSNFWTKKEKVETKDESAKDKEIPQETKDAKDVGSNDTPAPGEDTIVADTKGTDEPKDDTKEEIKEDVKEEIKEDAKEEIKEEKKKGSFIDPVINAITSTFKTTKEEKTTTSEVEAVEKPEATEPAPEEQKTGAEPSKDEESQTPDKPKEEPTKIIANLSRRITSVFKKKPEKAPCDEEQKDDETSGATEEEKKKKRLSSQQKKRSGSQSEEKEPEVVQDEFEIIHAEVMKEYPDCAKQGKLHKENHSFFKRDEPRYFAFHGGILYYFKDIKGSKTKKQIKIEKNCNVKKTDNKRFEIVTPTRTYKLQAPNEEEQTEWIKVIEDHISSLPEESTDKKELPEVTNVTNSEDIQGAVDEAANASKESTEPSTEPKTEPKTESDVAEKSEITPAAPATTANA